MYGELFIIAIIIGLIMGYADSQKKGYQQQKDRETGEIFNYFLDNDDRWGR